MGYIHSSETASSWKNLEIFFKILMPDSHPYPRCSDLAGMEYEWHIGIFFFSPVNSNMWQNMGTTKYVKERIDLSVMEWENTWPVA